MHHARPLVPTGALITPSGPAGWTDPDDGDSDGCPLCGSWSCDGTCPTTSSTEADWAEAVAAVLDDQERDHHVVSADIEVLAETRAEMLAGYGQLVLGAEVDAAGMDTLGDMVAAGVIRPEDLVVPGPAAKLLSVTAWVGEDIEKEDNERGYEPEDLTVAPACAKGDPPCHCGATVVAGSACGACGCSQGGPKLCDR
jgi:hypothetical protein